MNGDLLKSCGGIATVPTVDLTQGLVAHYLLNNNADDNYGAYDGNTVGVLDYQGDMVKFDGNSNNYIARNLKYPTTDFIISFWAKMDIVSTVGNTVWSDWDVDLNKLRGFGLYDNNVYFYTRDSGGNYKAIGSYITNTEQMNIHHYVCMQQGTVIKLYLDSILQSSLDILSIFTTFDNNGMIGRTPSTSTTLPLNGKLSNFRIYNEAKDQTFIDALYAEGYYPKPLPLPTTDGLVAYYPLTGTAEDKHGTYNGVETSMTYIDDAESGSVSSFSGVSPSSVWLNYQFSPSQIKTFNIWAYKTDSDLADILSAGQADNLPTTVNTYAWLLARVNADGTVISAYGAGSGALAKYVQSTNTIPLNKWTMITFQFSGDIATAVGFEIFINTVKQNLIPIDANAVHTQAGYARIGAYSRADNTVNSWFGGRLKYGRIYNKHLTQQEITDIYNYEKNFRYVDIDEGLVAYYPLKKNSLDNYKNQHDGTDTEVTYDGNSGAYNGSSSRTTLPSTIQTGAGGIVSYSAWVKVLALPTVDGEGRIVFSGDYDCGLMILANNSASMGLWDGTTEQNVASPISLNVFYHIAGVYDGSTIKIYINSVLKSSAQTTITPLSYSSINGSIGGDNVPEYNYLNARIARIRVYNKAITAEQVKAIYNSEKGDFI